MAPNDEDEDVVTSAPRKIGKVGQSDYERARGLVVELAAGHRSANLMEATTLVDAAHEGANEARAAARALIVHAAIVVNLLVDMFLTDEANAPDLRVARARSLATASKTAKLAASLLFKHADALHPYRERAGS